jgi:hypothetical protein
MERGGNQMMQPKQTLRTQKILDMLTDRRDHWRELSSQYDKAGRPALSLEYGHFAVALTDAIDMVYVMSTTHN